MSRTSAASSASIRRSQIGKDSGRTESRFTSLFRRLNESSWSQPDLDQSIAPSPFVRLASHNPQSPTEFRASQNMNRGNRETNNFCNIAEHESFSQHLSQHAPPNTSVHSQSCLGIRKLRDWFSAQLLKCATRPSSEIHVENENTLDTVSLEPSRPALSEIILGDALPKNVADIRKMIGFSETCLNPIPYDTYIDSEFSASPVSPTDIMTHPQVVDNTNCWEGALETLVKPPGPTTPVRARKNGPYLCFNNNKSLIIREQAYPRSTFGMTTIPFKIILNEKYQYIREMDMSSCAFYYLGFVYPDGSSLHYMPIKNVGLLPSKNNCMHMKKPWDRHIAILNANIFIGVRQIAIANLLQRFPRAAVALPRTYLTEEGSIVVDVFVRREAQIRNISSNTADVLADKVRKRQNLCLALSQSEHVLNGRSKIQVRFCEDLRKKNCFEMQFLIFQHAL